MTNVVALVRGIVKKNLLVELNQEISQDEALRISTINLGGLLKEKMVNTDGLTVWKNSTATDKKVEFSVVDKSTAQEYVITVRTA